MLKQIIFAVLFTFISSAFCELLTTIAVGSLAISALAGAGQIGMGMYGMKEGRKEARRTERLQLLLADKETKREDEQFNRTMALNKEQLKETKKQNNFSNMQTILNNLNATANNNWSKFNAISQGLRSRNGRT